MSTKTQALPEWFPENPYPDSKREANDEFHLITLQRMAYAKALEDVQAAFTARSQEAMKMALAPLPRWFPSTPYPIGMTDMTVDRYVEIVPDGPDRTGISWLLMGHGYRVALQDIYRVLLDEPDIIKLYHAAHAD